MSSQNIPKNKANGQRGKPKSEPMKVEVEVRLVDINTVPPAQAAAMREVRQRLFESWFREAERKTE